MRAEGLPREQRVRRRAEFQQILHEGHRVVGRYATAYWARAGEGGAGMANRVGVAAGKRLGGAVVRNALKRRLREAYRRNKREVPWRGIAIVLVASRRMIGRGAGEVERDVRGLLRRIAESLDGPSPPRDRCSSHTTV